MNIRPTALTVNCCALIRTLLPAENMVLFNAIHHLASELDVCPTDCLDLIKRTSDPSAEPVFDGHHTDTEWYNNNIQMPRVLISLTNHLGITDTIPATYRVDPTASDTLSQAHFFLDAYIKRERQRYAG